MAPYNAAKAALNASTTSLRLELTGTGIRVIEIQPADINTGFHHSTKKIGAAGQSAWKTQQRNMAAAPEPECVAQAVRRAIYARRPAPVMVVGGFFQARLAPVGARLLPHQLLTALLRRYYRL
jgi:NAD(P)-dependent dehydrogenase (short-subunit alcohol dehydrogenase family)